IGGRATAFVAPWPRRDDVAVGTALRAFAHPTSLLGLRPRRHTGPRSVGIRTSRLAPGDEHSHPLAIALVILAEEVHEVVLFEEDADEDVRRRHCREQEMPDGHHRREPERDDEAKIDRMTYEVIEHRRLEACVRHRLSDQVVDDLMQAEQLEM